MLNTSAHIREIDARSNGGITVTLSGYFNSEGSCEYAVVNVDSPTATFTISEIPLCNALDVYNHPFCYADRELTSGRLVAA
jgi:hypothetical protein